MRAFVGQSRSRKMLDILRSHGIGEMHSAGQSLWPPRLHPWILDTGAFPAWRNGHQWNPAPFLAVLAKSEEQAKAPMAVDCPDIVAGGLDSLKFSMSWVPRLEGHRLLLAVQDGMTERHVEKVLGHFSGLFVGGTLKWKIREAERFVHLAHLYGMPCHIGRVGIAKRVRWARRIRADSIDSSQPLWSMDNLGRWLSAMGPKDQLELL